MQGNRDQMITEHGVTPELMFEPKKSMSQGIILLGGPGFQPDPEQAMIRLKRGLREMGLIIPDREAVPTWLIDQEDDDAEENSLDPRSEARWVEFWKTAGVYGMVGRSHRKR